MSRFSKIITFAAAMTALVSCASNARIDATVSEAASSEMIVKLLNSNRYEVLDTVKTDAAGHFTYKVAVAEGQPEFVYLFHGEKKVATLLVEAGDKVTLNADATIEGSEESVRLAEVEKKYADVRKELDALAAKMSAAATQAEFDAYASQMSQVYVAYYREMVGFVLSNSHSMAVIPVFYQVLGENLPLFSQSTDAILYSNVADSLETVYPESKYVKALRAEADRRFGYLELEKKIMTAEAIGYPDIELPGLDGKNIKLSDVDSKVTVVAFWSAALAQQNLFNVEYFKPLYEKYHGKGLEIYQVSLDVDKTVWATTVKGQKLPWINVCDSRGGASPYVTLYNLAAVPSIFVISDGELVDAEIVDEASFTRLIDKLLK